ncbi:hypothetical protein [Ferrimonas marina]|uniref:Sel1 repeat-containing protein n=1 Tax=Ferrimonas marina TaxID=299255 RepID=A0A1M5TGQ9_9GAMM|nr:hypothetical protein [Ferrimonas marina]SHH50015.1 hypothetical protein SAMN02745129_2142 [Ferrimonas marina]
MKVLHALIFGALVVTTPLSAEPATSESHFQTAVSTYMGVANLQRAADEGDMDALYAIYLMHRDDLSPLATPHKANGIKAKLIRANHKPTVERESLELLGMKSFTDELDWHGSRKQRDGLKLAKRLADHGYTPARFFTALNHTEERVPGAYRVQGIVEMRRLAGEQYPPARKYVSEKTRIPYGLTLDQITEDVRSGKPSAMVILGDLLHEGWVLPENRPEAQRLYAYASQLGYKEAESRVRKETGFFARQWKKLKHLSFF